MELLNMANRTAQMNFIRRLNRGNVYSSDQRFQIW